MLLKFLSQSSIFVDTLACVSLPMAVKVKFEFSCSKEEIVGVLDV